MKVGDPVAEHQTLAEMETDKALVEVPSPWAGTIQRLHGDAGDIIDVGSKLVSYSSGDSADSASAPEVAAESADEADAGTVVGNVSSELSMPASFSRDTGAPVADDSGRKSLATPAIRRMARELEIDINRVSGTGRGGRVTASDVQSHAGGSAAPMPAAVLQLQRSFGQQNADQSLE